MKQLVELHSDSEQTVIRLMAYRLDQSEQKEVLSFLDNIESASNSEIQVNYTCIEPDSVSADITGLYSDIITLRKQLEAAGWQWWDT